MAFSQGGVAGPAWLLGCLAKPGDRKVLFVLHAAPASAPVADLVAIQRHHFQQFRRGFRQQGKTDPQKVLRIPRHAIEIALYDKLGASPGPNFTHTFC